MKRKPIEERDRNRKESYRYTKESDRNRKGRDRNRKDSYSYRKERDRNREKEMWKKEMWKKGLLLTYEIEKKER